jgi:hypothetical protein
VVFEISAKTTMMSDKCDSSLCVSSFEMMVYE